MTEYISKIKLSDTKSYELKDLIARQNLYNNINNMINDESLSAGKRCITFENGIKNTWSISNTSNKYSVQLSNGLFAILENPVNVKGLNLDFSKDISDILNTLLTYYYNLHFDNGIYYFNISLLNNYTTITGNGIDTVFMPAKNDAIIKIKGNYYTLKNFKLSNAINFNEWKSVIGISITSAVRCHFAEIYGENLYIGVKAQGEVLWTDFDKCSMIGIGNIGWEFITTEQLQLNNILFKECESTNCGGDNWFISDGNGLSFGITLLNCTFEQNGFEIGNYTPYTQAALFANANINVIGGYFENNKVLAVRNYKSCNILQSSFISENIPLIFNSGNYVQGSLNSCYGFNITSQLYMTGSQLLTQTENNYGIPTN